MWTSHDTVGFVFLAGFCVQFGFSFEGKDGRFFFPPLLPRCHRGVLAALYGGKCSVGESVKSAQPFCQSKGGYLEGNILSEVDCNCKPRLREEEDFKKETHNGR